MSAMISEDWMYFSAITVLLTMHNTLIPGFQHKVTVSFFPMSFSAESHTHHTDDGLTNGMSVQMICILHSGQAYCCTALGPISLAVSTEYVDEPQCQ